MTEARSPQTQSIQQRIAAAQLGADDAIVDSASAKAAPNASRRFMPAMLSAATVLLLGGGLIAYLHTYPIVGETAAQGTEIAQASKSAKPGQAATPVRPEPQAQPAPAAAAPTDPFSSHAAGAGIKTCAATYAALGKLLTAGTQYMVSTETAKTETDKRGVQGLVGMTFAGQGGDYAGPAAGVVFAAPNGDKCEGDMVRVVPFAQNCQTAAALLPKGSSAPTALSGVAVYALASGGQAMLLPAGNGCVAISILRAGN